ncbi:GNAT family N-acetyltransferase [Enterococcus sp.]|uniref:GNAT family N-acetyltransferase n=1 Tax=Enterococcus sp. TaxID=35783 RepID=UPI0025C11D66|nr:GNAT family N-acetyltransferase [Enterococcus sp.]
MYFSTPRCLIRDFRIEDIATVMTYRNDLEWMKYQGFKNLEKAAYIKELLHPKSFSEGKNIAVVHTLDDRLIGDIYLKKEADFFWIGYTIHPQESQKGYGSEVVQATVQWLFDQGVQSVKAGVSSENLASIKLLEKLNFSLVKTEEDACYQLQRLDYLQQKNRIK